ncbi:MAG: hypothetical protein CMP59_12555, partial [Flavobacteriales bacterium]|nr:hypothetical protein [Flavobacteriales bacterium]
MTDQQKRKSLQRLSFFVVIFVILLDQATKIWVKTNMELSEEFSVFGDWFYIHFTENNGMAFGLEIAGDYG